MTDTLRTLIVDDEPLAVERLQILAARIPALAVVGAANDGAQALRLVEALAPDLLLLDMTMPEADGLAVARRLLSGPLTGPSRPAVIFVTAHDHFAVEAFDCDAVDYVLKPVAQDRLERAVERALARRGMPAPTETPAPAPSENTSESEWIEEFWVPHRSELVRLAAGDIDRIDAERDYVRLHVGSRSYLMLHTIQGLEDRLDPTRFIRLHRSTIVRRDRITGLRHDGLGVWSAELADGNALRIGRTYLPRAKAMAGR
ncbi:LytR/AlgR family transcriptional regulator [Novosphingobium nitrogenifigens DSM 19370]|uniref:LytR/AlgR family transcriptional regulator n=1 Tax=Novosphingobium nitrogenifigens DSM 19370 TaxID=983920 RepID=F1Z621_9SPHN|nr:LytTR family DNA-binding domain-containing protein [Novosphingobium nitrogenifigens]EGD59803.1 LytR/AlgR family transcriptional regulator [Novosphingobium nitrogenifigens DSM 19370]